MKAPGNGEGNGNPLQQLTDTVSEQALVVAQQQVQLARRELAAKAREAGPGAAMVGGAALLATLASATGTAALVLLLAGRGRPSAAALGVTGAYAGAGALLAREGLVRLRATGLVPEEPVRSSGKRPAPAGRQGKPAAKPAGRSTPRPRVPKQAQPGDAPRRQSERMRRPRPSQRAS